MALTLVQHKAAATPSSSTTVAATFDSTPVQGNLLVAVTGGDAYASSLSGTGWAEIVRSDDYVGLVIWWKIAGASEPATVTLTIASSTSCEIALMEFSQNTATPVDRYTSNATGTTTATVSTGTTAATTLGTETAVAGWCRQLAAGVNSISNSFSQLENLTGTGVVNTSLTTATKDLNTTGTVETTAVFASTSAHPAGVIATFKATPGQTVRPDADTVTTGWTATPLYSKINDQSDATVVTATLA